ncbi:MAG TPA: histidine phosphatase family protein [Candidatus Ozemobacteraceae bacterium]|nr:histidine phosphatase family protein [Candidatus Ozemobacteraceae bacterium]
MKFRKYSFWALFAVLLVVSAAAAENRLIFAVSLIRHGDRAPYAAMNSTTVTYEWPDGIGELTPEGMNQEYQLGKRFRERYVDTFKLLPPTYRPNSLYVLSTSANRTVMSAQSFLAGLYPDGTGPRLGNGFRALPNLRQPVPVMTIPRGAKNIINPEHEDAEKVHQLIVKHGFTQPEWIRKEKELEADFKRWSRILGVEIRNLEEFLIPADHVYCMSVHGVPMPKGLTKADTEKIVREKMSACAIRFVPKEVARHMASGFLTKLDADMRAASEGKQKYQCLLYIGHDDSILGLMSALGKPLANNPAYASHVDFELYRDGANCTVKTFFNGKPVPLAGDGRETLSLKEFLEYIKPNVDPCP